jgi:hypothetical protein
MAYSMSSYYNHCKLKPLGRDLQINMYTNALETVLFC